MTGEFGGHLSQQIVLACCLALSQHSSVVATLRAAVEDGEGWQSCLFLPQHGLELAEANCGTIFPIELRNTRSGVDEYQRKGSI